MNKVITNSFKIFIFSTIIIVTIAYSYYQTKAYVAGPVLELTEPKTGSTQNNNIIFVKGYAKNISYISLNDKQIFVDEHGKINEKLLLSAGYNVIKVSAQDKYERIIEKQLELVYRN